MNEFIQMLAESLLAKNQEGVPSNRGNLLLPGNVSVDYLWLPNGAFRKEISLSLTIKEITPCGVIVHQSSTAETLSSTSVLFRDARPSRNTGPKH